MLGVAGGSGDGGDGGGGEGRGRRRGGGGDRRRGKQKVDEAKEEAGNAEEGGGNGEGGGAGHGTVARRQQPEESIYRGVRAYLPGDATYPITYVSCVGTDNSPHNNRQIWLGRYYDELAAAMAVDIFLVFNHDDVLVNFPQYLHYYIPLIPRRGLDAEGRFLEITAADLERIKHITLGIIRAFYPNSCAAIHTRRNHRALPSSDLPLTHRQRQAAAAAQASYHAHLEQYTYTQVLTMLAATQQRAGFGAAAGSISGGVQAAMPPHAAATAADPSLPARIDLLPLPASAQTQQMSYHDPIDFSAIRVPPHAPSVPPIIDNVRQGPTSPDSLRLTAAREYAGATSPQTQHVSFLFRNIDFSANHVPPGEPPAPPIIGNVRRPPTSSDTLRLTAAREHAGASYTLSPSHQALFGHFPVQYSPLPTPSHVITRPSSRHAEPSSDPSILRSLEMYPRDPRQSWNPLIRSNIDPRSVRPPPADTSRWVSIFQGHPSLRRDPGARVNEAGMRVDTSQTESSRADNSSFPLVQRVVEELAAGAPYPMYGREQEAESSGARQRYHGTSSMSGGYTSAIERRHSASAVAPPRQPDVILRQAGRPQSLSAFRPYTAPEQPVITHAPPLELIPRDTTATSHDEEEDQKVVPLRRQSPEQLPLFDVFARQASATGELGSHHQLQTHEEVREGVELPTSLQQAETDVERHHAEVRPAIDLNVEARPAIDLNVRPATPEGASTTSINLQELERVSSLGPARRHDLTYSPRERTAPQHSRAPAPQQPDQAHDYEEAGGPSSPHLDKQQEKHGGQ
ncbi:hypothetical protein GOP47_0023167 [Adiantum capillus-veneris]|uniref:Uncharacterized protein n=1 Tax=Adiantum capillus-veneris TaxID=13818 RepID=A0A9D4U7V8_ADICA|nr:hypothetical protein GOP47_0023167 [Adiantum capillus-veneris]